MRLLVITTDGQHYTVDVSAHKDPREVILQVRDNGLKAIKEFIDPSKIYSIKIQE